MSHDKMSGPVTRKERRAIYAGTMLGRQAAPRYVFSAAAHVRKDWTVPEVIERLEDRAKGYNGILRQLLCTSAAIMRMAVDVGALHPVQAENEALKAEMAESRGMIAGTPIIPANISPSVKRNQQPGRLSGSERKALKDFVAHVQEGQHPLTTLSAVEVMAEGRALLTKVRKRALGAEVEETVDCNALMPVGVEEGGGA